MNRDCKGQWKANMNDGERMTPAEKAARRAELARLSAQAAADAEAVSGKIAAQMAGSQPVAVKRVDVMVAHEARLAKMRMRGVE